MNKESIKKINKYSVKKNCHSDIMYRIDLELSLLAIKPNNLFFQKNDVKSNSCYKFSNLFKLQSIFTKRMYYQYDPKFVAYYEPFMNYCILSIKLALTCLFIMCATFLKKKKIEKYFFTQF